MGYPSPAAELRMLESHGAAEPIHDLEPVADALEVRKLIEVVRSIHVSAEIQQYVVDLLTATRTSSDLRLGASPRAGLQLLRASRASAALDGRDYVLPDDVQRLASSVLAHRLLPSAEAQASLGTAEQVVAALLERTPLPGSATARSSAGARRR